MEQSTKEHAKPSVASPNAGGNLMAGADKVHQIIAMMAEKAKSLMEALGISKEQLEFVYEYGIGLYEGKKYNEAKQVFYLLWQLDGRDARFPFAYASCCSQLKDLEGALQWYSLSAVHDGGNPDVWFNLGDCYLQRKEYRLAVLMLDNAIAMAGVHPDFSKVKQDAENMRNVAMHHLGEGASPDAAAA